MAYSFKGNNDFRGWLAADPNNAWALDYVGNKGDINTDKLTKAGGVDAPLYSYDVGGATKAIQSLYSGFQDAYTKNLSDQVTSAQSAGAKALAALQAQPRLPKFDYSANYATAQATAANTVNPVYQDKLNRYLEKKNLEVQQQTATRTRNKEDIATALTQALEDTASTRTRTSEDVANKMDDITASENTWQRQEGRDFDRARTGLLGNVANAGLTESGVGQGQVADAVTDRNIASEDQTRQINNQRRDTEIFKTRTLADLDKTDTREKGGATRRTENEDIALRDFVDNKNLEEGATRADLEVGRVNDINSATNSAYQDIVAKTLAALAGSGTRAQDLALFKQVYG